MKNVTLRNATAGDTPLVAWTVLTALDMDASDLEWVMESCADHRSMYSWNKAIIATVDGVPAGCIVSYPGDDYESLRQYTWARLWGDVDEEFIRNTPAETGPGEYYLDSLAIKEEYRGHNIGKQLMEAAMAHGRELGYNRFGLLVDINKPRLQDYYASLGFSKSHQVLFFGHTYWKMTL